MGIFPAYYCAFEIITLLRVVFFYLFNVICANSLCFEQNENKMKTYYGAKLQTTQNKLTNNLQFLHNRQSAVVQDKTLKINLL